MAHPPHQERHIRTLTATVGVQFIENQEFQSPGVADDLLVEWILTGEDVLQHHVVREQDVRRVVLDLFPFLIALLARVAREGDPGAIGVTKA